MSGRATARDVIASANVRHRDGGGAGHGWMESSVATGRLYRFSPHRIDVGMVTASNGSAVSASSPP